jgi:FkbM family methyltransferase
MDYRQHLKQRLKEILSEDVIGVVRNTKAALSKMRVKVIPRHKLGQFPLAQHTRAILRQRNIDCVIDVGANTGQYGHFIRHEVGFDGPIISFEPVPATFSKLQAAASEDGNWKAFQMALGREPGLLPINVMASSVFSSFKRPTEDSLFAGNKVVSQVKVKVERLDRFIVEQGFSFNNMLLKLDTQGFDLEVLRGAEGILDQIQAIQTELSFLAIYDGMPAYNEVSQELKNRGFVVSGMYPVTLTNLQAIEFDGIFVREGPITPGVHMRYEAILLGVDNKSPQSTQRSSPRAWT